MMEETERVNMEALKEVRRNLKVGDTLTYVRVMKVSEDERLLVPIKTAVRVKAKYPHIVELEESAGHPYPIKTMTYVEIMLEDARRQREKEKKPEKRRKRGKYHV